jgi:hypothetical protein
MTNYQDTPGITYQASLPLSWRVEPAPSLAMLTSWRYSNISLLRGLATLEYAALDREHDGDTPLNKALDRLESKLDIALTMLARVTMQNVQVPAPVAVTLSARSVEWLSDQPLPATQEKVLVSLYLSPRLPEPLQLHARVVTTSSGRCVAQFLDEDEEFDEWMTRTLFRYHRRGLQARRGQ